MFFLLLYGWWGPCLHFVCVDSPGSERLDLSCFTIITCSDIGWPGRLDVGLCSVCGGDTQAGEFLC